MYIVYNSKIMIQTGGQTSINDNNVKIHSNEKIQFTGKYTIEENEQFPKKYDEGIYAFENQNTLTLFKLMDKNKSFFSKKINTREKVTFKKKEENPICTLCMGINNLGTKETTVKNLLYKNGNEYISLDDDDFIPYLLEKFNKYREFGEFIIAVYVYELMKSKGKEGGQSRRSRQSRHNRQDAKPKRRTIKKEKRKK